MQLGEFTCNVLCTGRGRQRPSTHPCRRRYEADGAVTLEVAYGVASHFHRHMSDRPELTGSPATLSSSEASADVLAVPDLLVAMKFIGFFVSLRCKEHNMSKQQWVSKAITPQTWSRT